MENQINDRSKSKNIDQIAVSVAPFDGIEALQIKAMLVRKIAPAIGMLTGALSDDSDSSGFSLADAKIDGALMGQALESLMANLPEGEFVSIIERLMNRTVCTIAINGKTTQLAMGNNFRTNFNIIFGQKLLSMYKVLLFILEVNYPDFFGITQNIGNRLRTQFSDVQTESGNGSGNELEKLGT